MSFADEIRKVLELERAGHERLAAAHLKAEQVLEEAAAAARRLSLEAEQEIAHLRKEELARVDTEIEREIDGMRQQTAADARRLRDLAKKAGENTVERILVWLWEER